MPFRPPDAMTTPAAAPSGTKDGPCETGIFIKKQVCKIVPIPAARKVDCNSPVESAAPIAIIPAKMIGGT